MARAAPVNTGECKSSHTYTGASVAAVSAANEEILNSQAIDTQVASTAKPTQPEKPVSTPRAVATPLPPLKPKKAG